ncbi:MAG: hydantoinase/oxoprolinase family protein [Hyphomicrobium sp.]
MAGLDVGGAHLKVALVEDGRAIAVKQFVCPLWQGMEKLDAALMAARPLLAHASRHAVTMTGELSDLFEHRASGVATLADRLTRELGAEASYWLGEKGFGNAAAAKAHTADTGSTNFLATASAIARREPEALLVDFGSTTADIIAIHNGAAAARGLTDADRLATSELVYTGLTRTAVMGVATQGMFKGRRQGLAREYLATMADVRRILGGLADGLDLHATADGRGKSQTESIARLARMFGRDAADGSLDDWQQAAAAIADIQLRSLADGCDAVLTATPLPATAPIVAAGIGATVVKALAQRFGRRCVAFGDLIGADPDCRTAATHSAPAVAVAMLAHAPDQSPRG